MSHTHIGSLIVLPDWLTTHDFENNVDDALDFCVTIHWQGHDRYSINQGVTDGRYRFLSRQDEWQVVVSDEERENFRFTLSEATAAARRVVNSVKVNGRTKQEWDKYFSESRTVSTE
jgi:hypothetical protein